MEDRYFTSRLLMAKYCVTNFNTHNLKIEKEKAEVEGGSRIKTL